jgi:hypothetical protein
MTRAAKFGIGDKVRVVGYGSKIFVHPTLQHRFAANPRLSEFTFDMRPELVGKEGIVSQVSMTQDIPSYAIEGIPGKHAWYDEEQLELITKNNATQ